MSRNRGGARRTAGTQLAILAGRLTPADRALCRLLGEHQVLAAGQAADLVYGSAHTARHRLLVLHRLRVVDRFRPLVALGEGSAPYHYVLGEAGAQVLAAEHGVEVGQLGYRRDRALAVAHSPALPRLLAANGFFAALARAARHQPGTALLAWWPARRCAQQWGELVRPDGYGRWRDADAEVDFFLEVPAAHPGHDQPTSALPQPDGSAAVPGGDGWVARLAEQLAGYAALAAGTQVRTPVLLWCSSAEQEAAARAALPAVPLPVATAPQTPAGPAGPVWLPLGVAGPRRRIGALATS